MLHIVFIKKIYEPQVPCCFFWLIIVHKSCQRFLKGSINYSYFKVKKIRKQNFPKFIVRLIIQIMQCRVLKVFCFKFNTHEFIDVLCFSTRHYCYFTRFHVIIGMLSFDSSLLSPITSKKKKRFLWTQTTSRKKNDSLLSKPLS